MGSDNVYIKNKKNQVIVEKCTENKHVLNHIFNWKQETTLAFRCIYRQTNFFLLMSTETNEKS